MAQTSTLPAPIESEAPAAPASTTSSTLSVPSPIGLDLGPKKVDSRDALIGVAVLVVLAIIFFVIKNAYANWRVRERVAPSRANASGWFLFLGLLMVATMAVLAVINSGQFLAPLYLAPLGGVAAISLVAWLMTFSAKR
ncbi:hypothetical protein JFV28_13080 [Pseudomonas sp. TH05]|jgi:hypothetical protein|uniref:hypothetical protein n=1 Tax=unclassified Pseudomonas TaxID=196821 RepID=UPI000996DE99|nr:MULTISPECIES: hypothetical protein [unclassified Pseudomonas]MBK5538227.1 hypothetical protein [Pseudomonas sp. TH07]MBK5556792.1 hypothetical protein [Pseudomonas sp. TH05]OOV97080.1 hypothetical protein MF4836_10235 [Pseudomonas sp. MF4836]